MSFTQENIPLVLASGSPRRRELLSGMGLTFTVLVSDVPEDVPDGTPPAEAVAMVARRKAEAVIPLADADAIILAADTTVALDGVCLGKPRDTADATAMLMSLSGRTHTVYTAVSVAYRGRLLTRVEATGVRFRAFDRREAEEYVKTGEPMDKAGSYGIQGLGGRLVLGIDGEFDNVVGLPCRLVDALLSEVTA